MKVFLVVIAVVVSAASTFPVQAAAPVGSNFYWSVAGGNTRVEFNGRTENIVTMNVTVGAQVHPNVNVEGFYGDSVSGGSDNLEYQTFGARVKPHFDISEMLRVYGQLGANEVKLSRGGASPAEKSTTSVLYGVGGVMNLGPTTSLYIEYNSYLNDNQNSVSGFNWGVSQRF